MHMVLLTPLLVRVRRAVAAAITLAAALAGCGQPVDDADPRSSGSAPSGEYVVTDVTDGGKPRALVPGSEIRLSFRDGQLGARAGCNHLSAAYEIDGDVLTAGPMGGTEMGCPAPLMEQDTWLAGLFAEPVRLGDDPLTITAGEVVLTLVPREQAAPDRPLAGTRWVLDGVVQGDAVSSVPGGPDVVLVLAGTTATITGLCNGWSADVAVGNGAVTWTPGMRTLMACADEARNQLDTDLSALLTGRTAYDIEERTLRLTRGESGLVFRAAE